MGGSVYFIFEDLNRSRGFRGLRRGSICGHFHKWIGTMSILMYFFVVLPSDDLTNCGDYFMFSS